MARFNLPVWHSLYQDQTMAELLEAFVADKLAQKEQLFNDLEDTSLPLQARSAIQQQIAAIDRLASGDEAEPDDILDEIWEAQMAAGLEPDLDLTVEEARRLKYGRS